MRPDRVGLGWRPALAAGIFDALDRIDLLEVIADDYLDAGRRERQALKIIARRMPMHLHCIALGMAGAEEVAARRLDRLSRLVNDIEPEAWSEHLAFVRAGGTEIGHLAAPPRTEASIEGAVRNLRKAANVVGAIPLMENIATLIEPPCSTLSEPAWISNILAASGCALLLDLHNLYANAVNFGLDPMQYLSELPLDRLRPYCGRQMDQGAERHKALPTGRPSPRGDGAGVRAPRRSRRPNRSPAHRRAGARRRLSADGGIARRA